MAFDDADLHTTYHVAGETDHVIPGFSPPLKEKYKKRTNYKIVASIAFVFVLTIGAISGAYLVQRNQDIRRLAATPAPTISPTPSPTPSPTSTQSPLYPLPTNHLIKPTP